MQTLLKTFIVVSLTVYATMSLHGATRYINWTGNNSNDNTNDPALAAGNSDPVGVATYLYQASNWASYGNGSPSGGGGSFVPYVIDSAGNGTAATGDVIQLRVRGDSNLPTTAIAPAISNADVWSADAFTVGDRGTSFAKLDSGHTMNLRNAAVGVITGGDTAGDGTFYIDGTLNTSGNFYVGQTTGGTSTRVATGEAIIGNGGTVNASSNAQLGVTSINTTDVANSGTLTIQTGGVFNHITSNNGFVIGKSAGTTGTLNMQGGTANIYSLTSGDNTAVSNNGATGQTVNIKMIAGELNITGWINGKTDDPTVTRNLEFDEGIIYIKDKWNATGGSEGTGQWQGNAGQITKLLNDLYGADGSGIGTLTTIVSGGGLSDASLIASLSENYSNNQQSIEVSGGTIWYGRDNDYFGAVDQEIGGGGRYAIWAVPEPSSYSLIAGILAMTAIMLRRRL